MEQSGRTLSMLGSDRWKGGETHNGTLMKIHDNSFTVGYSHLMHADDIPVKFGFGAWYDKSLKNNEINTVKQAGDGVFAGILIRQVHIATGYPAKNNQIDDHNKGLLAKDGYIIYKTGFDPVTGDEDQAFADVEPGMLLCINEANGRPTFQEVAPADHEVVGIVVGLNPDDKSWTVRIATLALTLQGEPGVGVPAGGTTGQVLAKVSDDDYDTHWITA